MNAAELLGKADRLDAEAEHNEDLAENAITDRARKRLLWEANKLRGEAGRRRADAEKMLRVDDDSITVGGVTVSLDDADFSGYEIPQRVRDMPGDELNGFV